MKNLNLSKIKVFLVIFVTMHFLLVPLFYTQAIDWPTEATEGLKSVTDSGLPNETLGEFVGTGIKYVLGVVGIILIILLIFGGFKYMTSEGNEENIEGAKKLLKAAVIGLIIVVAAYIVTDYVINSIFE